MNQDVELASSSSRRGRARLLLLAALLLVAGGAVGGLFQASDQPTTGDLCAAELVFEGRTYAGRGEQVRTARPGPELGRATVAGCGSDDYEVTVAALTGVDPDQAVLADGRVWLSDQTLGIPTAVAALAQPVRCTHPGTVTLAGDWVSVRGPMPEQDYQLTPPYTATIDVEAGRGLPLERYASVRVEVLVTEGTLGGTDPELARAALGGSTRVRTEVGCDGDDFVAASIDADR